MEKEIDNILGMFEMGCYSQKEAKQKLLNLHSVSHFSEIYVTFDEDDGSVGTAFDNKEKAERDAAETCCGLMTMRLIHGK